MNIINYVLSIACGLIIVVACILAAHMLTDTIPVVYWSTSKDECVKVYDGYQIIECSEFDFYDAKYERIWAK